MSVRKIEHRSSTLEAVKMKNINLKTTALFMNGAQYLGVIAVLALVFAILTPSLYAAPKTPKQLKEDEEKNKNRIYAVGVDPSKGLPSSTVKKGAAPVVKMDPLPGDPFEGKGIPVDENGKPVDNPTIGADTIDPFNPVKDDGSNDGTLAYDLDAAGKCYNSDYPVIGGDYYSSDNFWSDLVSTFDAFSYDPDLFGGVDDGLYGFDFGDLGDDAVADNPFGLDPVDEDLNFGNINDSFTNFMSGFILSGIDFTLPTVMPPGYDDKTPDLSGDP